MSPGPIQLDQATALTLMLGPNGSVGIQASSNPPLKCFQSMLRLSHNDGRSPPTSLRITVVIQLEVALETIKSATTV